MSFDELDAPNPIDPSTTTTSISRDAVSDLSVAFDPTGPSNVHLAQEAPPTSALSGPPTKRQKLSRSKVTKVTKPAQRSLSTPQVRGLIMSDESEADKKRNKLGYQRISIACAHCRRRKIRCLVADVDPQGRCQNCIRLKKECVFYPVDQQGVLESSSQSAGVGGVGSGPSSAVSSSTPPDMVPGRTFDGSEGFPTVPSNAPVGYPGPSIGFGSSLPSQEGNGSSTPSNGHASNHLTGRLGHTDPGYRQHTNAQSPWTGASGFRHPISTPMHPANSFMDSTYWRQNAMASPGDFAPFPIHSATSSTASPNPYAFTHQATNLMWPPSQQHQPVRSMSYGQIEGYAQNMNTYGDLQLGGLQQPPHLRHNPPTLEMQSASMMAQAPGPHSAPIPQHAQSFLDQQHAFGLQHSPYQQTGTLPSSAQPYSGTYYNTSPQLSSLHEEQDSPGGVHRYTHHSSQPG